MKPFEDSFKHPNTVQNRSFTPPEAECIKGLVKVYVQQMKPGGITTDHVPRWLVDMAGTMFVSGVLYAGKELKNRR